MNLYSWASCLVVSEARFARSERVVTSLITGSIVSRTSASSNGLKRYFVNESSVMMPSTTCPKFVKYVGPHFAPSRDHLDQREKPLPEGHYPFPILPTVSP